MGPIGFGRRWSVALLATLTVAGLAACAAPSGDTVVPAGCYRGEISVLRSLSYWFTGTSGDAFNVWAGYWDDAITNDSPSTVTVTGPGTTRLLPVTTVGLEQHFVLPTSGTYKVQVAVSGVDPFVHAATTCLSVDQRRGTAPMGVVPAAPILGQSYLYDHAGSAGERLNAFEAVVVAPDGQGLAANGLLRDQVTLPVTGSYTIRVGYRRAALSHDVDGGTIGLGHTSTVPLVTSQHVSYSLPVTAGQAVGVSSGEVRVSGPGVDASASTSLPVRAVFTADGTATIVVTQREYTLGGGGAPVDLWLMPDLDGGVLPGAAGPVPAIAPGQSVAYGYAGIAGTALLLRATDGVAGISPRASVVAPDGAAVPVTSYDDGTLQWSRFDLPVTGAYRVVVSPAAPPGDTLDVRCSVLP